MGVGDSVVTHFAGSELPVQSPNHSHFAVIYFLHDISHGKNLILGKSQRFLYHIINTVSTFVPGMLRELL